jgi:hypothetical protein
MDCFILAYTSHIARSRRPQRLPIDQLFSLQNNVFERRISSKAKEPHTQGLDQSSTHSEGHTYNRKPSSRVVQQEACVWKEELKISRVADHWFRFQDMQRMHRMIGFRAVHASHLDRTHICLVIIKQFYAYKAYRPRNSITLQ